MGCFSTLNLLKRKERLIALFISLISFILFFLNSYLNMNYYLFEIDEFAIRIISFVTITSTMGILGIYFYLHSFFLEQKKGELEYLANTDSLTQISNRRNFLKKGEYEFMLASKYNHTFSLLLLDIDHFKLVNDNYGHDVGDEVLKQITKTIKENIRKTDVFARYGGEEFILLLRKTDLEKSMLIAEKIRVSIEQMTMVENLSSIKVTMSVGVVEYTPQYNEFYELITKADEALYRAKDQGRNCVRSAHH